MKAISLIRKAAITTLMLVVCFSGISAQSITGDWYGILDIQGIQLRISLHVASTEEGYSSTWDSPDQDVFGIPSSSTSFKYPIED